MDLDAVSHLSEEEVAARLNAAGPTRGDFMNTMMALRILSMAHVLTPSAREELTASLQTGQRDAVDAMLGRIRGVGPAVLRTFWTLRKAPEPRCRPL